MVLANDRFGSRVFGPRQLSSITAYCAQCQRSPRNRREKIRFPSKNGPQPAQGVSLMTTPG